jgi:uncharacterized protein (DUF1810 family)
MTRRYNLERFVEAQKTDFRLALSEVQHGRKRSHWMWYVFPQVQGLGFSQTSKFFAIQNLDEAKAFLDHPVLGPRLLLICNALLVLGSDNANEIFGSPDDMKLNSAMTLFASVPSSDPVFEAVLEKFFDGIPDEKTLRLLEKLQ